MTDKTYNTGKKKTFQDLCLEQTGHLARKHGRPAEPFGSMEYGREYEIKNRIFHNYCNERKIGVPENLIASPGPRYYRTTSKRRVIFKNKIISLMHDIDDTSGISMLEPVMHTKIFKECETVLRELPARTTAGLNYSIIKGTDECTLIINSVRIDRHAVNILRDKLNTVSEKYRNLKSAYLFCDPTRSKYYLDTTEMKENSLKRLFGPRLLKIKASGKIFQIHPLSFSQVNMPVAELIAERIDGFFGKYSDFLIDLYCGYGFFSCTVGEGFGHITGMDNSRESINTAKLNASHLCPDSRAGFFFRNIDAGTVNNMLRGKKGEICMILDPPKKGCLKGVIRACAGLSPVKVAHLFCGTEELGPECSQWINEGYAIRHIVPFDMFSGTASVETLVLLEKKKTKENFQSSFVV